MSFGRYSEKCKEVIAYIFFGFSTTIINVLVFWLLAHWINLETMISTVIAWIVSVTFAYVTNRKWVFKSKAKRISQIGRETFSFFSCRFATGIVDWLVMWILVDIAGFNDMIMKCVANILVIILNYIASKCVIFRRSTTDEN